MEMNRDELMTLILDHYESPRNRGSIHSADISHEGVNPGCGDIVKMFIKIDDQNIIEDVKFMGEGCILSQAGASIITENVFGKAIQEVEIMTTETITDIIGKDLALARPKCTTPGLATVKSAIREWKKICKSRLDI